MSSDVAGESCLPPSEASWVTFNLHLPAHLLEKALDNPDAIQVAMEVGRLDFVSLALTVLAILLGVGAFGGFWLLRGCSMNAAAKATPEAVDEHLQNNGQKLIREALSDPQMLSRLQETKSQLGLDDADDAEVVDEGDLEKEASDEKPND